VGGREASCAYEKKPLGYRLTEPKGFFDVAHRFFTHVVTKLISLVFIQYNFHFREIITLSTL